MIAGYSWHVAIFERCLAHHLRKKGAHQPMRPLHYHDNSNTA